MSSRYSSLGWRWFVAASLICLIFLPCNAYSSSEEPEKISLIPLWIPQAQFAGYMMAKEKGFYSDAGMDVTILKGGPSILPLQAIASREATFAIDWLPKCIQAKANGLDIVNIGQIIKDSAYMIVCKKTMATVDPKSLNNRKLAHWVGIMDLSVEAFLGKFNIQMEIVPNYTSVNLLLTSAVDAISAMRYNEYHQIINSGYDPDELVVYDLKDLGMNIPEDGLYCLERTYQRNPELCKRFVTASLLGWQYAFEHKEETLAVVMREARKAHTGTNMAHQRWMLNTMEKLIKSDDGAIIEKLDKKTYESVCELMIKYGYMERAPKYREFYKGP